MQIYLLRARELRMTLLPSRVSGQHSIDYTNEHGAVVSLLKINARNDKWYLSENKSIQISPAFAEDQLTQHEYELKPNHLYYLRRENQENMILLVEADTIDRRRYSLYKIPDGGIIDVGQASYNQIQYMQKFVQEQKHIRIHYQGDMPLSVSHITEYEDMEKSNPAYINNERIINTHPAHVGDVIFLFGMKIALGKGFIAVNDPDHQSTVRLESFEKGLFVQREDDEEIDTEMNTFSSAPRERKEFVHRTFKIEQPPEGIKESETPWIVMMGPSITMAMGSVFSSIITINNILSTGGSIQSALPSLVTSIVMVSGSCIWPVIGRRVQHRNDVKKALIAYNDYEDYLKNIQNEIEACKRLQKEILVENNPLLEECVDTILKTTETLWERSQKHKDFLEIMIGRGDVNLDADFSYPERSYQSQISKSALEMYNLVAKDHVIKDVPITIPLKNAGIVGIIGDRDKTIRFVKALLIELTAMHNYEDLKIIFIYNESERQKWEFVKWIPHLWNDEHTMRYLANDSDEVKVLSDYIHNLRSVEQEQRNTGPYYILIAADKTLSERAQAIKELYKAPDQYNMTMVALYDERQYLPKECSYVIDLISTQEREKRPEYKNIAATLADYNDITGERIICRECIQYDGNPEEIFTKMSNIVLDSPKNTKKLPSQLTFMDMYQIGKPEHLDLMRRWRENSVVDSMAAPLGIDADGYMIQLDIHEKMHGPHGVIAGMTGSGKSELIISYIAAMSINYSPEDVAFVFIDFKGGGMADIFKNLPHTAGVITNLDGNELKRSFIAIEHELEKRQKLFKEISEQKKISNIDIYKYHRLRQKDKTLKPLPHLILISDEFAELKQQQGDFMEQLIRIARIGRSLGVHLILATQKPDGVVDDQIKSNIRFKICLKVQDKSDSQGMIGRPDATLITQPGRFYFQVGHDEVFEYGQSPWSGAIYEPTDTVKTNVCEYIEVVNEQGMVICRESLPKGPRPAGIPEKQIDALVEFIKSMAEENDLCAEKLWLNPLPGPKAEKKKTTVYDTTITPFVLNPFIGMYDDLLNQKHLPLTVPFTTQGNAIVYGISGSGKLEFLNQMLVSLIQHHSPEEVNFYICDYDSGSLSAFAEARHTKAFVGVGERRLLHEMFNQVLEEFSLRRDQMRQYGGDYQNYVHNSGKTMPNIVLIVHNYPSVNANEDDLQDKLIELARDGVKYGIFVILTATAGNSVSYLMKTYFKNVYTLRLNSNDDYYDVIGRTEGIYPAQFRGRGLIRVDDVVCEFQTAIVFEDEENTYQAIQQFCRESNHQWQYEVVSEEVKEEIVCDYQINAIPILRMDDQSIVTYDLTENVANVIAYDESHRFQKDSILKAIRNSLTEKTIVYELDTDLSATSQSIEELWTLMRDRADVMIAAKEEGKPYPYMDPVIIFIDDPYFVMDELETELRKKLIALITHLTISYQMFFVITAREDCLNVLLQNRCLIALFPVKTGILLSRDASMHILFEDSVTFTGNAVLPKGYLIHNNEVIIGEVIEH